MSRRYQPYHRPPAARPRQRSSCLSVVVGVVVLLLLMEGYALWVRPQVSNYVGEQTSVRLGLPPGAPGAEVQSYVQQQAEQGRQTLPTAIAAMPAGTFVLSEANANAYLAQHRDELGPIDNITVRFLPGEVQADVAAMGTSTTVTAGLIVQNGQVQVVDPQVSGVLGLLLSVEELVRPLEQHLNQQLAAQGRAIRDGRVEQGQIVVTVE
jgi:hypothetical protein